MTIGDNIQHLVCQCNSTWGSILPAPPCPYHSPQAYNGLCNCGARQGLHPLHGISWTSTTFTTSANPYVGKHRDDSAGES